MDKELEKVMQAYRDLSKSAGITAQKLIDEFARIKEVYPATESELRAAIAKVTKETDMKEHLYGQYKGHDVYAIEADTYWAHKEEADSQDVYWQMSRPDSLSDLLIHRGAVMGIVRGTKVEPLKEHKNVIDYFPEKKPKPIEQPKQMGNPTAGKKKVVTERHTVDYYMKHTIEILEAGVKYGEEQLQANARKRG